MQLLLVEGDQVAGADLAGSLRGEGYGVEWVRDGRSVLATLQRAQAGFALMVLDWDLPRPDGLSVLRTVRAAGSTLPILMITARASVSERVRGLDSGADDYLVKPFELPELKARLRSLLRRSDRDGSSQLVHGDLALDPVSHTVRRGGRRIAVTPRELSLLACLMQRPQAVLSRSQLEERLYGWDEGVRSNAVEFLIHRLRRKLGAERIENVRGVGWRMAAVR